MTTATSNNLESPSIPDVSLKLEHMRHYLELADQQHGFLRDYVEENGIDISNCIGWLLGDVQDMLADVQSTLYPDGMIAKGPQAEKATH